MQCLSWIRYIIIRHSLLLATAIRAYMDLRKKSPWIQSSIIASCIKNWSLRGWVCQLIIVHILRFWRKHLCSCQITHPFLFHVKRTETKNRKNLIRSFIIMNENGLMISKTRYSILSSTIWGMSLYSSVLIMRYFMGIRWFGHWIFLT